MTRPISPYDKPGFYDQALADGRHRDIVGGRWDETGRAQMALLLAAGLKPHHHLLDIGAGSLRLGCKAVPYLDPGHYWATDKSRALMLRGRALELAQPEALPEDHLLEDDSFALPGVPDRITHAIAFAVFTHLPLVALQQGLARIAARLPRLERLLLTVFLAPEGEAANGPFRQRDGVVTHPDRTPFHLPEPAVLNAGRAAGLTLARQPDRLPRGQVLFSAGPV